MCEPACLPQLLPAELQFCNAGGSASPSTLPSAPSNATLPLLPLVESADTTKTAVIVVIVVYPPAIPTNPAPNCRSVRCMRARHAFGFRRLFLVAAGAFGLYMFRQYMILVKTQRCANALPVELRPKGPLQPPKRNIRPTYEKRSTLQDVSSSDRQRSRAACTLASSGCRVA